MFNKTDLKALSSFMDDLEEEFGLYVTAHIDGREVSIKGWEGTIEDKGDEIFQVIFDHHLIITQITGYEPYRKKTFDHDEYVIESDECIEVIRETLIDLIEVKDVLKTLFTKQKE